MLGKAAKVSKNAKKGRCLTSLDCSFQQYCNTTYSCIDGCESIDYIPENNATRIPIPVNLMAVVQHNWTVKSESFAIFQQGLAYKILSIDALCVALMISISANQQMVCVYIQMMAMVAPLIYLQIKLVALLMKSTSLMISTHLLLQVVSTTQHLWQVLA